MFDYTVQHLDHSGTLINTFQPENLRFTLRKGRDGPHDCTYELSRSFVVEDMVGAYRTDFALICDTSGYDDPAYTIMAGMHTSAPQITTDEERIQIAGKDWLHYLERRYWPYDDSNPNAHCIQVGGAAGVLGNPPTGFAYYVDPTTPTDSFAIITDILVEVLSETGSLPIAYSLGTLGHSPQNFSIDIIDSETILSKIQTLAQEHPGDFEFWIDSAKTFQVAHPYRYTVGVDANSALASHIFDTSNPGTGVFQVNYENVGPGCTRLIGQGSNQSSTLVAVREYAPATTQFRLLEDQVSFPGVVSKTRVQNLTRQKLLFDLNPIHNVSISIVPESVDNFWTTFQPGYAIWITADLEAHLIDAAFEIVSIDGEVDQDGNTLITFNLNQIYPLVTIP